MPPVPWQHLLPYHASDNIPEDQPKVLPPLVEADNSFFYKFDDPKERANQIARALAAGTKEGVDVKRLTVNVLEGLLNID